ncbi:Imm8 family immunity protein [Mesorhizobium calcicola]|uniref:Imm8 family immunity protein n=1 Tax=Mesorhizobium calcicola TaxID=1300310 RepID=A0ABW4WLA4_9HYPH
MSMSRHHNIKLAVAFGTSGDLPEQYQVIDFNQESGYEAPDPDNVAFQLSLDIGIEGTGKTDVFQCIVVTRNNIGKIHKKEKLIVLNEYTFKKFREAILNTVRSCEGVNWYDSLSKLIRKFIWEYEGMYDEDEIKKLN